MDREPNIYPYLFYRHAPAAIDWLARAFGFERIFAVPGDNGTVLHAEMRLGPGIIMLGSAKDTEKRRSPLDLGGVGGGICVYVADPRSHYERAKSAGAEIVSELEDKDYGGSGYTARDPEGHEWSFGSYRPGDPASAGK